MAFHGIGQETKHVDIRSKKYISPPSSIRLKRWVCVVPGIRHKFLIAFDGAGCLGWGFLNPRHVSSPMRS